MSILLRVVSILMARKEIEGTEEKDMHERVDKKFPISKSYLCFFTWHLVNMARTGTL